MINDVFATHEMSAKELDVSTSLRQRICEVANVLDEVMDCREKELAKTKLEEALMWANKAIVLGGLSR